MRAGGRRRTLRDRTPDGGRGPTKVAFWAGSFERAGTQRFLVEFLRRLDRERFDPVVLSLAKYGELLSDIEEMGIPVHEFGTGSSLLSPVTVRGLSRAALFLRRERVDVLSCLLALTTIIGPFVGRAAGVPVVVNNQRNLSYWLRGRGKTAAYGFASRRLVDAILVNSGAAAEELERRFSVPPGRIVNVGVGIDLSLFEDAEPSEDLAAELAGHPVVGIVAKLSEVKGHRYFVEAAAEIARARPDVRFLVVGQGTRLERLRQKAVELGVGDAITFAGERSDVPSILKLLDVFVLSSISEASPNVIVEAMASGLPVVATNVGGIPAIVDDGSSGTLVEAKDAPALARAILELVNDPARAASMGSVGKSLARERHDINRVVRKMEDTFTFLLDEATRGRGGLRHVDLEESLSRVGGSGRQP